MIRAVEIAKALGKVPAIKTSPSHNALWIGLNPPDIKAKIKKRTLKMISAGIIEETKKLLKQGVPQKRIKEFGFEYRAILHYLKGRTSKKDALRQNTGKTLRYSRKQTGWFKKNSQIHWLNNYADIEQK